MKPGVMYGNVLTGAAGFLLAARGNVDLWLFVATMVGMTLVVGGACALNNYLDRDIDKKMLRTQKRPSVTGEVPARSIMWFAVLLAASGTLILAWWVNWLVVLVGIIGFVTYVWFYGAWSKRQSVHGTIVGSISGAMPIVGGYAAVSGQVDIGMLVVFLILFFWQFPEFYSIAIYRRKEYAAANVPVISVAKGVETTIRQIFIYTVLYVLSTLLLTPLGYTGVTYFVVMLIAGVYWIYIGWQGFHAKDSEAWARKMFRFSMVTVLVLCGMLAVGPIAP